MALTRSELQDAVGTIFIVIMENRSFDHVLGHLSFNGKRKDVDGVIGPKPTSPSYINPANGQGYSPFLVTQDGALGQDLPHNLKSINTQLGLNPTSGKYAMNGFAQAYFDLGGSVTNNLPPLGFMDRSCVPVSGWFADNFTICDRWFSSLPTSTHPNKLMALAGKSIVDDTFTLIPEQDTLLDWLSARKIDWRVYHDGAVSFFALMKQYWGLIVGDGFRRFDSLQGDLHDANSPAPQVVIIEPAYADAPFEQHPNDNHPPLPIAFGENFLSRVYRAISSAPAAVSSRSVLIVIHDEHGGFWDHVPPQPTPGYTSITGTRFETTGPRVPAYIISPLVSAKRCVDDLLFDHTSILQFVAERFAPSGGTYSHEVDLRADLGFSSVSKLLDLSAPRVMPPMPDFPLTAPMTLQQQRPIQSTGQRAFVQALDSMLASSQYRSQILTKYPSLHAWDAA